MSFFTWLRWKLCGGFRPCIIEDQEVGITELVFEDCAYYSKPLNPDSIQGHWADALLAADDRRLVGVRIWKTFPRNVQVK